jgi:hypothetical protein
VTAGLGPGDWNESVKRRIIMCRAILASLASLLVGCASMASAPPERLTELQSRATACGEALPAITYHDVDRFGRVTAAAGGSDADVIQRNFQDCVFARGRWAQWTAGQPAPMLEPLGSDNPDASPALRIP